MADSFHASFVGLDKFVSRFKGADKVVQVEMKGWGDRSGKRVERSAKDAAPVDRGTYRRSITSVTTVSALTTVTKVGPGSLGVYPHVIEEGRRPGAAPPPVGVIADWLRRHGGDPKRAYIVARAIGRRGIPGKHVMKNALAVNRAAISRDAHDTLARIVRKIEGG